MGDMSDLLDRGSWREEAKTERDAKPPNPAKEVAALVEMALSPPLMGMGGGSATEEHTIDRWKERRRSETFRLRAAYGPSSRAPELHRFLDLAAEIFGCSHLG